MSLVAKRDQRMPKMVALLFLVAAHLVFVTQAAWATTVSIPDPTLDTAVRTALNKWGGDLTDTDMAELTQLEVDVQPGETNLIEDLAGLDSAIALEVLVVNNHRITSLEPIKALPKLTRVEAAGNQVSAVPTFTATTTLKHLDVSNNRISDLGPLMHLTALQRLYLGSNNVGGVESLAGLSSLEILNVADNDLTDVGTLLGLGKLTTLSAEENYLDLRAGSSDLADITTLLGRGVSVTYSPQKTVSTKTTLSAPKSVKLRTTLKLSGTVTPAVRSGSVRITRERLVGTKWKKESTKTAKVKDGKYSYKFAPAATGQWRFTAKYLGGTAVGADGRARAYRASTSATRKVTVNKK